MKGWFSFAMFACFGLASCGGNKFHLHGDSLSSETIALRQGEVRKALTVSGSMGGYLADVISEDATIASVVTDSQGIAEKYTVSLVGVNPGRTRMIYVNRLAKPTWDEAVNAGGSRPFEVVVTR